MKEKMSIKKIIIITLTAISGICLSFCLAVTGIIFIFLYMASQYTMNVFEINNDKYNIKIIEEMDLRGAGVETDLFSYENKNEKEKKYIGCGTLILVEYDDKKEYIYGKSEYTGDKTKGIGIYQDNDKSIIGNNLYSEENDEKESDLYSEFLKKQCTGYFVLNLKTGEYQGGLSEKQQQDILSEKKLKNSMMSVENFLKMKGKKIKNYEGSDWWMTRI